MTTKICSEPGCPKPVQARGLCSAHYRSRGRNGTLPPPIQLKRGGYCSIEGCGRPHSAHGLCGTHLARQRTGRDLLAPIQLKRGGYCSIEGCGRPHSAHGLCGTHLARQRTGRDLLAPIETGARRTIGTRHLVEDLEWLTGTDTPESIAVRVGYRSWGALADRLRRIDRPDLVAAIVERRELPKSPWVVAS